MKRLFILIFSIVIAGELEVDGNLTVTDTIHVTTIQSATIDSLLSLIAQLEMRITQLECQNTGIIPDGYCDCFFHTLDECDVCNGDTTSCQDCAGVPNGDSLQDMCGYCDNDSSNDCVQDCNGEWGGTAEYDECGDCGGDAMPGDNCCADCEGCDCDGYVYATVSIDGQHWFSENLRTTTDNSGNPINNMCYDSNPGNCQEYGNLYTYQVVINEDICPVGWHVATDEDWMELEYALGMTEAQLDDFDWRSSNQVGNRLKESGTAHWQGSSAQQQASNSSGFTGLPGGKYDEESSFDWIGQQAVFWSPSNDAVMNYYRGLHYADMGVFRGSEIINGDACSVRCIQD